MKNIFACLVIFTLSIGLGTVTYGKGKVTKEIIASQDTKRSYYLFVPEKLSTSKPLPLIVLLHGSNRNGLSLVDKWKDLADKEEIVLAGPDAKDSSRWAAPQDGPDFLRDLVEDIKLKYPINGRRVYLFGHSAGAGFALQISLLQSEYFAATGVHAGALSPEGYSLTEYAKRKIPMAIWVGDRDPFFPLDVVRKTRDALISKGFSLQLTEMPNHDHWYYDLAPKINRDVWEFLKGHELSTDPHYQQFRFQD